MDIADLATPVIEDTINDGVAKIRRELEEKGTGFCFDCGEAIDPKRLAVKPNAERCIECQLEQDRIDRLYNDE